MIGSGQDIHAHNVGVTLERTYEIKRVDADFFTEE